ncbi:MAG TPA: FG-GAP repeat protein [Polyangiaceae bacterium]
MTGTFATRFDFEHVKVGFVSLSIVLVSACSWSRYDDLLQDSPIQMLKAPSDQSAFGRSVAALRADTKSYAFATAYEGFAVYEFDEHDLISNDPFKEGVCSPRDSCWLTSSTASLNHSFAAAPKPCFAYGIEVLPGDTPRLTLFCIDGMLYSLPLPEPVSSAVTAWQGNAAAPTIRFASGPRLAPDCLLAALPESGALWFYPPDVDQPVTIPAPATAGKTFAEALAISGSDAQRKILVGEPDQSILRIYQVEGGNLTGASACIQGDAHFASALAVGRFASSDSDGLAVASDDQIIVIGDVGNIALSDDPAAPCLALADLSELAAHLGCAQLNAGNACNGQLANAALAAVDLDGDAKDELIIGAPAANERGSDAAGKIYLARLRMSELEVVQELSPSSIESGDRFGSSIVGVPMSRPEVILAGAPGGNKLAALFCTNLITKDQGGVRCE